MANLPIVVEFVKIHQDAKIPQKSTDGAAGFDIFSCEDVVIYPESTRTVQTGLKISIPPGYEGQVRSRSGLAHKHRIHVLNSPGTIDEDYTGPLAVILHNSTPTGHSVGYQIKKGDRIAQLVVKPVLPNVVMKLTDKFDKDTVRGDSGFGSTGR